MRLQGSQELSWSELDPRPETGWANGAPHLACPTSTCLMSSSIRCHRMVYRISPHLLDPGAYMITKRAHCSFECIFHGRLQKYFQLLIDSVVDFGDLLTNIGTEKVDNLQNL
jgi:hypothetical protein